MPICTAQADNLKLGVERLKSSPICPQFFNDNFATPCLIRNHNSILIKFLSHPYKIFEFTYVKEFTEVTVFLSYVIALEHSLMHKRTSHAYI